MTTIQVRVDPRDKKAAEKVLASLGLDVTTAVRMYLKRIVIENGIPFPAKHRLTVNGFTPEFEQEVLRAAKEEEGSVGFDNAEDAIKYLHSLTKKK